MASSGTVKVRVVRPVCTFAPEGVSFTKPKSNMCKANVHTEGLIGCGCGRPSPEQLKAAQEQIAELLSTHYSPSQLYHVLDDVLQLLADEPYEGVIPHDGPMRYRLVRDLRDCLGLKLIVSPCNRLPL